MALDYPNELRDPIHGLIRLSNQEIELINSRPFQRLRRIRQLAAANLVFPGALHTRFDHSLGTMHLAGRLIDHLLLEETIDDTDIEIIRLAALLHDVGHGPFSHVSDYLLGKYYDKDTVGETPREKIHEKITVDIINNIEGISSVLTDNQKSGISTIILGDSPRDYRRDIVSSSLDADKMDYLIRDAHFSGVKYGVFDLDKVIESCMILRSKSESYLAISESGIFAVEQLVLAKHHMTQQIYAHRVRTITDVMIVRGLEQAIEEGHEEIKKLYAYNGSKEYLDRYLDYDDGRLSELLNMDGYPNSRSIFNRLRERHLFKELALINLNSFEVSSSITRSHLLSLTEEVSSELEVQIAAIVGCEPWEIIVYKKFIKNPAYQAPGEIDPEAIHVRSPNGATRMMSEFDNAVIGRMPVTERLHVIGPPPSGQDSNQDADEFSTKVKELIFSHVGR